MIEQLSADTTHGIDVIGGKGTGLVRLLAADLDVPDAWCIPAAISRAAALRTSLRETELPGWWDQHGAGSLWAVRSSAVAEDLADASFAGVYETFLGIDSLETLGQAVESCWQSAESVRANGYREHTGTASGGGIAVLVQRLISPRVAGVMLTANPDLPFADQLCIDASWGLGESVVSGAVDPDHLEIDWHSGEITKKRIGTKSAQSSYRNGKVVTAETPKTMRGRLCLDVDDIAGLTRLANAVESRIGPRRDLEWAIDSTGALFVLQDRPITGLPPRDPVNIVSRTFGDEYLAGCARPLQEDIITPWLRESLFGDMTRFMGRGDLSDVDPVVAHRGYAYMNGEWLAEIFSALPKSARQHNVSEWFPAIWRDRVAERPWNPVGLVRLLGAPLHDLRRSLIHNNLTAMQRHADDVVATLKPRLSADYTLLTQAQWIDELEQIYELGHEHFRVLRWGMGLYNPMLHTILSRLLVRWCNDDTGDLYQMLISRIPETWTARINDQLASLATTARDDAVLRTALRDSLEYRQVRKQSFDSPFWDKFDTFISEHGHRAASRDPADPRWHEDPDSIVNLIRAQIDLDPGIRNRRDDDARGRLRSALGSSPVKRRILNELLHWVLEYTRYREDQRYYLDFILSHLRNLLLEQARRLIERGLIEEVDEIYLLRESELRAFIAGGVTGPSTDDLAERRAAYERDSRRLPLRYLYDGIETDGDAVAPSAEVGDGDLVGVGVSRGLGCGPARLVFDIAGLAEVEHGDVLVVKTIDPAWTSVFSLLTGLVTETGGVLSHGAILAREYGIPTVSGVANATETFATGILLSVDGTSGIVRRLASPPLQPETEMS